MNFSKQKYNTFSDVINKIDEKRIAMVEDNPFFDTLKDDSLSTSKRLSFMPYMVFFSCGCPDVITQIMRIDNVNQEDIDHKVNSFIKEDNFHYNYYLHDLEELGYSLDRFGSVSGVIRHIFSKESIPVRKLIYNLAFFCKIKVNTILKLALVEMLEAGLVDLFTNIYKHIVKKDFSLSSLKYFGDTHVSLEKNHTITSWFSKDEIRKNEVGKIIVPVEVNDYMDDAIITIMDDFDKMYYCFYECIINEESIYPHKFDVQGAPPIDQITEC